MPFLLKGAWEDGLIYSFISVPGNPVMTVINPNQAITTTARVDMRAPDGRSASALLYLTLIGA